MCVEILEFYVMSFDPQMALYLCITVVSYLIDLFVVYGFFFYYISCGLNWCFLAVNFKILSIIQNYLTLL